MTRELCGQACADRGLDWAAIKDGGTCFCGTKANFKLGDGNYVNEAQCTATCKGDASQKCGYWGGLSVFNVTASGYKGTELNKAPGYVRTCIPLLSCNTTLTYQNATVTTRGRA